MDQVRLEAASNFFRTRFSALGVIVFVARKSKKRPFSTILVIFGSVDVSMCIPPLSITKR